MKIKKVTFNNKKRCFEVFTQKQIFLYPYSRLTAKRHLSGGVLDAVVDKELGGEAFSYRLESGAEGTVHLDQVLEYNRDSDYLREMLLYKLTLKAQQLFKEREVSKREVIRRMGTTPTQLYRLLDQSFYHKTIDQMVKLLAALDCPIDVTFKKAA